METPDTDPVGQITAAIKLSRQLADQARTDLTAATPMLIEVIRCHSGQSAKIERILWSCWNDEHQVNLCDALCGLDAKLVQAAVAMIAARAHCGGNVDELLRKIIGQSGSQPPPSPLQ